MNEYVINGGKRLEGELHIDGSKNAVLPIMAATILTGGMTRLEQCPRILDVDIMVELLQQLGCKVKWENDSLIIDSTTLQSCEISEELVKKMRSSIILLGAILGRCKEAKMSEPGGCKLGARPINLHLMALKKMGIEIVEQDHTLICTKNNLQGATIDLSLPSVGATENIMLAAVLAQGLTIINNAAREPEIIDLQNFLNACGAQIAGAGTCKIQIHGVRKLHGTSYRVIPDRIIAGTYLVAAAITRGHVTLYDVNLYHLKAIIDKLQQMGCHLIQGENQVEIHAGLALKGTQIITAPYPGYPTDMQSQMMALCCTCNEKSYIKETLFEARFKPVSELCKMGAEIEINNDLAIISPTNQLYGTYVKAMDLRGGAALVIAGLAAQGCTCVTGIEHIERGYHNIVSDLKHLGADIRINKQM